MEIAVYSPVPYTSWESYGLIALQLVKHLRALGVTVSAHGPGMEAPTTGSGGIVLGPPYSFAAQDQRLFAGPHIAVSMFESSRIPPSWLSPLNECDAVIVPSWFALDAFRQSGVTSPVHVIPLGAGEQYRYHQRAQAPTPLTFLAFLDRGERKGGQVALQAFLRAFGEDTNYRLILKGRAVGKAGQPGINFTNPNIEVIQQDMDEQELLDLYYRADVLISAHKGEGFGLLPREFAATGGLALATDWSGTADALRQWGYPLPYTLTRATWLQNNDWAGQDLGQWAEVDSKEVAKVLRLVADYWLTYRAQLPRKAAAVRALYSWHEFAKGVLSIWEGAQERIPGIGNTERLPVA
jgi:glycosyltransferase involved in cell wall biosynthesis